MTEEQKATEQRTIDPRLDEIREVLTYAADAIKAHDGAG